MGFPHVEPGIMVAALTKFFHVNRRPGDQFVDDFSGVLWELEIYGFFMDFHRDL
jgi:hypothetical protein